MYEIKIIEQNNIRIGEIIADDVVLSNERDALDMMANVRYYEGTCVIIRDHHVPAPFFDLSTKLAGAILQKFSQYLMRIAIVGDFSKYSSKNLKRFINESNKGNQIFFVEDITAAIDKFTN